MSLFVCFYYYVWGCRMGWDGSGVGGRAERVEERVGYATFFAILVLI